MSTRKSAARHGGHMPNEIDLKIQTAQLRNVEILKAGTWNGHDVTPAALDKMVENFNNQVLEPYLNLDHDDQYTNKVQRALKVVSLGFVSQLKRVGDTLVADFVQVPVKIAELIQAGMLKKRSVEYFPRFNVNKKLHEYVLKAVSFFGADIPAVNGLSNDFDVLLKSKDHAIALDADAESITLSLMEKTNMDKIELLKSEYDALVSAKSESVKLSSDLEAASAQIVTLKNDLQAANEKLADQEIAISEAAQLKKDIEAERKANLKKEAEAFIDKAVEDGKVLPKFKESMVEDYMAKAADESKIALFKEEIESRGKVINLGETRVPGTKNAGNDISKLTNDEINELIEAKMDANGTTFEVEAKKLGLNA